MITKERLIEEVFKEYVDPELGIDIWTLGLIYDIIIKQNMVNIKLTFTSPFCPYGPQMVDDIETIIRKKGVKNVSIEVTFDPPWQPSEELKEILGLPQQ